MIDAERGRRRPSGCRLAESDRGAGAPWPSSTPTASCGRWEDGEATLASGFDRDRPGRRGGGDGRPARPAARLPRRTCRRRLVDDGRRAVGSRPRAGPRRCRTPCGAPRADARAASPPCSDRCPADIGSCGGLYDRARGRYVVETCDYSGPRRLARRQLVDRHRPPTSTGSAPAASRILDRDGRRGRPLRRPSGLRRHHQAWLDDDPSPSPTSTPPVLVDRLAWAPTAARRCVVGPLRAPMRLRPLSGSADAQPQPPSHQRQPQHDRRGAVAVVAAAPVDLHEALAA